MNFSGAFDFWLAKVALDLILFGVVAGVLIVGFGMTIAAIQLYEIWRKRK